jgi:hypothetical protein
MVTTKASVPNNLMKVIVPPSLDVIDFLEARLLYLRSQVQGTTDTLYTNEGLKQLSDIVPTEAQGALAKAFWDGALKKLDGESLSKSIIETITKKLLSQ